MNRIIIPVCSSTAVEDCECAVPQHHMCGVTHLWILLQQNYSRSFWHPVIWLRIYSTKMWHSVFWWMGTSDSEEAAVSIFYIGVACTPVVLLFNYQTTQHHIL